MYMAWLCFRQPIDDEDETEAEIKFEEPDSWLYEKILPISFNILHKWSEKDLNLYDKIKNR